MFGYLSGTEMDYCSKTRKYMSDSLQFCLVMSAHAFAKAVIATEQVFGFTFSKFKS